MTPTPGLARTLAVLCLSASLVQAQEGHPPPTPPPPGARSITCSGRPVPQLEDITQKAGITFSHASDPAKKYLVESMSGGVLLIDYNRDGWPDIYFTNAPSVATAIADPTNLGGERSWGRLYRNNHDGTFTDVTAASGLTRPCFAMGGAVGDYNNDGWPDIYLACLGHNLLYHNNGDGTFTDVTAKAGVDDVRWSTGAAFGDYDLDGYVDLMVTNYVDFHLNDLPQFGSAPNCKYRGIDVQCGPRGLRGAGDSLFHNNGNGTFTNVSTQAGVSDPDGYYGMTALFADFNNTGRPDIYVANDSTPKFLYKNLGNGTFKDIGLQSGTAVSEDGSEQASMGVAIGDYNHSGRPSLYITNFSDENDLLYRNDGDWNFTEVSYPSGLALPNLPYVKWGTDFIDVDNDGWLDLITVDGHVYPQVDTGSAGARYREPKFLSMNQGDGTFCDASTQAGPALMEKRASRGVAIGDLFNDGNMDIVVGDLDGAPMLLRNHGIPGRHWISFELAGDPHPAPGTPGIAAGHASNRLALNARLKIVAGGMTQTDEIHSGGSYLSQNDLRVHFGLGKATQVDRLEIRWPSGRVETLKNIPEDNFYFILEGHGLVPADQIRPTLRTEK
jgi:hypothetical protein